MSVVDAIDSLALEIESEQAVRKLALRDFSNEALRPTLVVAHDRAVQRVRDAAAALLDMIAK